MVIDIVIHNIICCDVKWNNGNAKYACHYQLYKKVVMFENHFVEIDFESQRSFYFMNEMLNGSLNFTSYKAT